MATVQPVSHINPRLQPAGRNQEHVQFSSQIVLRKKGPDFRCLRSAVDSVGVLVDSSGGNCADCEFGIHEIDLFLSGRFDFSIGRAREVPVVREASIC